LLIDYLKKFLEGYVEGSQLAITHSLTVSEQLAKLADGILLVDREIQRLVLNNHEDLLSQATWIEKLEGVLSMMSSHIQVGM